MQTLTVDNTLFNQIAQAARQDKATPDEITREAFRLYFWERQQREISAEVKQFRAQHEQLKTQYLGQYIAMHKGKVVDHAKEFAELHSRVRARFGSRGVLITLVEETPNHTIERRNFQFGHRS